VSALGLKLIDPPVTPLVFFSFTEADVVAEEKEEFTELTELLTHELLEDVPTVRVRYFKSAEEAVTAVIVTAVLPLGITTLHPVILTFAPT